MEDKQTRTRQIHFREIKNLTTIKTHTFYDGLFVRERITEDGIIVITVETRARIISIAKTLEEAFAEACERGTRQEQ